MKHRSRVRSNIKARPPVTQKDIGSPPNWGAYAYSHTTPYWNSADADLSRDDWGRAEAYKLVGTVRRCVDLLSQALNDLDWHIVRDSDGADEIVATSEDRRPRHPAAQAIHEVFADQGSPLFSLWVNSRSLYGETYIEKRANEFGLNRGITWLYPYWCEPETSTGRITGYRYGDKNGQSPEWLRPDQVAFDRTHNPTDGLRGLSLVDTALPDINGGRELKRFIKWTLANNARPGLIASPKYNPQDAVPTRYSEDQVDLLQKTLSDSHVGTHNASTAIVMPSAFDFTTLEGPELDKYRALMEEFKKDICIEFGVPLAMAGDSSSTTFKDGEEVRKAFYINTVVPLAHLIQDFFNIKLMPFLDPDGDCTFQFDTAEFEDSTRAEQEVADLTDTQLRGSYLTLNEARVRQGLDPIPELEGLVMVGGVPTPLDQVGKPAPATPAFGQSAPLMDQHLLEAEGRLQIPAAAITPDQFARAKQAPIRKALADDDYCILAPLPNDAAIRTVQDTLRGLIPASNIMEWQDPATFHLTLTYATGTPEQVASVALDDRLQTLIVDRVDQFDTPEGYAVHLKVRPTKDLVAYQARLVADMRLAGMDVSTYSDVWEPHITLCYTSEPITPFAITPLVLTAHRVDVSNSDYETIRSGALKTHAPPHDHAAFELPTVLVGAEWREKALSELKAWQKHVKASKSRAFDPVHNCGYIADLLREPTAEAFDQAFAAVRYEPFEKTKSIFKAFAIQRGVLSADQLKAWTETRDAFSDEVLLAIAAAADGTVTEAQFESNMRAFIRDLGEEAYRDGLADAGVDSTQLDDDDRAAIDQLINQQNDYVFFLADRIYTNGLSVEQEAIKPDLWVNKTLVPFYQAGLAAGGRNSIFEWVLGDTEHCDDCLVRSGVQQAMKTWVKDGVLPQSSRLACGGWRCGCKLRAVRLKPSR